MNEPEKLIGRLEVEARVAGLTPERGFLRQPLPLSGVARAQGRDGAVVTYKPRCND